MRHVALALLFSLTMVGCVGEPPTGFLLVIDSEDLLVPDFFDEVEVTTTASKTAEGLLCEPIIRRLDVTDDCGGLPCYVGLEKGHEFDQWVALRVRAFLTDADLEMQEVYLYEQRLPWPVSGRRELRVSVDRECYYEDETESCTATHGPEYHCVEGDCVPVPDFGLFEDESRRESGVSCYRVVSD